MWRLSVLLLAVLFPTSVALAGPKSPQAAEFYGVAEKLMERAKAAAAAATDVIEIS